LEPAAKHAHVARTDVISIDTDQHESAHRSEKKLHHQITSNIIRYHQRPNGQMDQEIAAISCFDSDGFSYSSYSLLRASKDSISQVHPHQVQAMATQQVKPKSEVGASQPNHCTIIYNI
jgi:hypothetical protein